jgi:hypothetical protein
MVSPDSDSYVWFVFFKEAIFPQSLEKVLYVVLSKMPADAEFSDDLIDDLWLGGPALEKFEDSRADEVEVEHLALLDI